MLRFDWVDWILEIWLQQLHRVLVGLRFFTGPTILGSARDFYLFIYFFASVTTMMVYHVDSL